MLEKCRICLRTMKGAMNDVENCVKLIKEIAQMEICLDPRLPSCICHQCIEKLLDAFAVREMFVKSEEHWMEWLLSENLLEEEDETETIEVQDYEMVEEDICDLETETKEQTLVEEVVPIRCCACGEYFATEETLKVHCLRRHKIKIKKRFKELNNSECRLCERIFDEDEFWSHEYEEPREVKVGKDNLEVVTDSVKTIVNEASCCQCSQKFASLDFVRNHIKNQHPDYVPENADTSSDRIQCKVCLGTFKSLLDLTVHRRIIEKVPYVCARCDKTFLQAGYLKNHTEQEHADYPPFYKCNQCDKTYDKFCSLTSHFHTFHSGDNRKNVCDICGKIFAKNYYLVTHREIEHFGIKKYKCPICSKLFPRKANLNSHMKVHTGEKPYKCAYCEKCYGSYTDMKTHAAAKHTGEWSIYCPTCNRGFMKPSQLKIHLKSHGVE